MGRGSPRLEGELQVSIFGSMHLNGRHPDAALQQLHQGQGRAQPPPSNLQCAPQQPQMSRWCRSCRHVDTIFYEDQLPAEKKDLAQTLGMTLEELESFCRAMQQDELALLDWWLPDLRAATSSQLPSARAARILDLFINFARVVLRGAPLMLEAWGWDLYAPRIEALKSGLLQHPGWESYRARVVGAAQALRKRSDLADGWRADPESSFRRLLLEVVRPAGPSSTPPVMPVLCPPVPGTLVPLQQAAAQAAEPSSPVSSALVFCPPAPSTPMPLQQAAAQTAEPSSPAPSTPALPTQRSAQRSAPARVSTATDPFPAGHYRMSALWDRIIVLTEVSALHLGRV